ncbi:uncharacterized protein LOC105202317 [Solenopsis invicta]|uniref:uncharacterized protein LOC105202317 n=1 Tax=Solenopsis invicta TaxID=13686 RepID=UPI000595B3B7|nr:uncharacterized protein LOC105202317 [Solenopsis invicta]
MCGSRATERLPTKDGCRVATTAMLLCSLIICTGVWQTLRASAASIVSLVLKICADMISDVSSVVALVPGSSQISFVKRRPPWSNSDFWLQNFRLYDFRLHDFQLYWTL